MEKKKNSPKKTGKTPVLNFVGEGRTTTDSARNLLGKSQSKKSLKRPASRSSLDSFDRVKLSPSPKVVVARVMSSSKNLNADKPVQLKAVKTMSAVARPTKKPVQEKPVNKTPFSPVKATVLAT